jgi:hypothetical protein
LGNLQGQRKLRIGGFLTRQLDNMRVPDDKLGELERGSHIIIVRGVEVRGGVGDGVDIHCKTSNSTALIFWLFVWELKTSNTSHRVFGTLPETQTSTSFVTFIRTQEPEVFCSDNAASMRVFIWCCGWRLKGGTVKLARVDKQLTQDFNASVRSLRDVDIATASPV